MRIPEGRDPKGRHQVAGRPGYAPTRMNGVARAPADRSAACAGISAGNGRSGRVSPASSGPMPAYGPRTGAMPRYPRVNGSPGPGYPAAQRANARLPATRGRPVPGYPADAAARCPPTRPATALPPPPPPAPASLPPPPPRPIGPSYRLRRQQAMRAYRHQRQPIGNWLVLPSERPCPGPDGDKVLREHRDVNGGWLRPAMCGAMDGLVTKASLIAGIGGGREGTARSCSPASPG